MEIILLVVLIVLILIFSGLMSGSEAAVLSVSLAKARELTGSRNKKIKNRAKKLLLIKEDLQRYITTIVVLNNLINIVGSIYVGYLVSKIFGSDMYLGLFSGILTFLIIIFAEIIPKIYGEMYANRISLYVASPLILMTILFTPIIYVLNKITTLFIKKNNNTNVSEGEIREMAALGEKEGSINSYENDVISNVFKMNDTDVYDIMVPKNKVAIISLNDKFDDIIDIAKNTGFTRFPVISDSEVVGFINVKDLFKYYDRKSRFHVNKILRPIIYAPETMKIFILEETLKKEHSHLAIVVNEHGDFTGIVTLEDIIEELLGEIEDEFDQDKIPTIRKVGENLYHIDASESIEDIREEFDLDDIDVLEDFSTLNGYLTHELGKIPKVNDKVKTSKGNFRVIKANKKRALNVELFLK